MKKILRWLILLIRNIFYKLLKSKAMDKELKSLQEEVTESKTIMGSAKALIVGLAQKLTDAINSGDPKRVAAIRDELNEGSEDLAAAVAANTPAAAESSGQV